MKPKLQVCRVSFSYHSKHKETLALSDISFTVEHGEFVAILGPSGCGKSTLLSLICGLDEPEAGAIFLDGELLEKNPGNAFHIGYMFQKDQLFEWRDILSNVSLGLEIQHQLTDDRKKELSAMLSDYGLAGFEHAKPSALSGGMRQRAALIRTLALKPDLLLLDEPFSALDHQNRLTVCDDISSILRKTNKTAVLVTHDLSEAISFADRIIVLTPRPGRIRAVLSVSFPDDMNTPLKRRNCPEFSHYFDLLWKELKTDDQTAGIILFILFLSLWELTASLGMINRFIFSCPSQILLCLFHMFLDKSLFLHTGVTLTETLVSFFLCTLISLITALFLWSDPLAAQVFEPFLVLLNSLPKSALAPLLLVWLGSRMRMVVTAAVSIAVFGSVMTLYTGFNQMDHDKIRLIFSLGGSKKDVLTKVLLPGSLPLLMSTMKVNIGLCLVGVIIGEFLSAKAGLGYLITYASQTFEMTKLMSALIILCLLSWILYQGVTILEKRLRSW